MNGVSLFCGCGGDTYGMFLSNINVIGCCEIDKDALESHKLNFSNCNLIGSGNVTEVTNKDLIKYKSIDFLFGGFPCQTFSQAGKKKAFDDNRGKLYEDFVRITDIIQPKWIIGENVKGILTRKDNNISAADIICSAFEKIGYNMKYFTINTIQVGLPQKRDRVIFIGSKKYQIPSLSFDIKPTTLEDILEDSLEDAIEITDIYDIPYFIETSKNLIGKPHPNLIKLYNSNLLSFGKRISPHHGEIANIKKPTKTLISHYAHCPRIFVPLKKNNKIFLRTFTIKECARIQGFPDNFKFYGKKSSIIKQIGNAISPIVVNKICSKLIEDKV